MKRHRTLNRWAVAGAAMAALAAGCASRPDPAPALAAGAASVEAARAAGAADYAAAPLDAARAKLERAKLLAQRGDTEQALRLAQQADLDAQLARALAGAERSQRAVGEVDAALRTLRRETERPAPPPPARAPRPPHFSGTLRPRESAMMARRSPIK